MTRSHGPSEVAAIGRAGWALAVLAVAEVALVGWALTAGAVVVFVLGQALLAALLALVLLRARYLGFRGAYELDIARRAAAEQRVALAEELHDVLGHELSLIALRAGALQVTSTSGVSDQAAQVRAQVEQAVVQLRQTVELLRSTDTSTAPTEPAPAEVPVLVERARSAGVEVTLHGVVGADVPAPVRMTTHRVVQECLTNAVKHSPGSAVDVRLTDDRGSIEVTVTTARPPGASAGTWSGLAALQRRVTALGGTLTSAPDGDRMVTHAVLPLAAPAGPGLPGEQLTDARRPAAATARWALLPATVLTAALVGFYWWAYHDATLEQKVFDRLAVGQPAAAALEHLPPRQAPVRLAHTAPRPVSWWCGYYTDGNFPLATASYEICHDGIVVTRVADLRKAPLL